MRICLPVCGGRWDGHSFEHYLNAMPEPGRIWEFPANGRFNSMFMFCGSHWQFIGYRQVIPAETNCKGK